MYDIAELFSDKSQSCGTLITSMFELKLRPDVDNMSLFEFTLAIGYSNMNKIPLVS